MENEPLIERRSGADRRRSAAPRNGLAVLMAGCSECERIAPSPIELQIEGWLVEYDDQGLVRITCPAHRAPEPPTDPTGLPDYIVKPGSPG